MLLTLRHDEAFNWKAHHDFIFEAPPAPAPMEEPLPRVSCVLGHRGHDEEGHNKKP